MNTNDPLIESYKKGDLPALTAELLKLARYLLPLAGEEEVYAGALYTIFSLHQCPSARGARTFALKTMTRWNRGNHD